MSKELVERIKELGSLFSELTIKAEDLTNTNQPIIGIGITTHNRYEVFASTLVQIQYFAPANTKIVIVDDASEKPVSEATYRFNQNVGIAKAKNKCFELLYNAGCEHFFLFDDDCHPVVADWHKPYIESQEPHLNYIFEEFKGHNKPMLNDTLLLYSNSNIKAYSHARGCMCYYKRICLDVCGGMSPLFGKWGFEHPDLSNRIYNAGLTSFRYMDVPDSGKLICSIDEHTGNANSTVQGNDRKACIEANSKIYDSRKDITEYVEFREKKNIILTCFFTKLRDYQRESEQPMQANKKLLYPLIDSMKGQKLVVITDCFDNEIEGTTQYINVETSLNNIYFQRWVNYYQYLLANKENINQVFIVDGTDVQMLNNPFDTMQDGVIYVGDEAERTGCKWLFEYHQHTLIQKFINKNANKVLLNAGLLGGSVDVVISFINKFLAFYFQSVSDSHFNENRPDCGIYDMGLFNYIARTHFSDRLVHGTQVNTVFKDDKANNVSWFKHK
ncbi:glycosyltransferase family 2 protein [Dysgonomonas sp. GY617]|uniref:glycosyltransferase family 2 protein n=1 Tax=Dysgonomonas sp. GY617 TaxID=2780420 RepID=UPI001883AA03|nr:glycosyltransferase family 2 protein [Dysgonomonas sp. GY617]MBF0577717.1 glycosyltransferase family 2 protein [Dysgonomonas sp. GY617]